MDSRITAPANAGIEPAVADTARAPLGWIWLAGAAMLVAYRLIAFLPAEINSFAASHYLFSYVVGFHKRGLPGTVLGLAFQQISAVTIYAFCLCLLGALAVALLLFLYDRLRASAAMLVLGLVLLGAPGALPHFAYALGYFDPILVICALLALLALKSASLSDPVKVIAAFVPCAVGVLTHESFVLTAFPLLGAYVFAVGSYRKGVFWVLTCLVLVLTAFVQAVGHPSIPLADYVAAAASRTRMGLDVESFRLLYFKPGENLSYLVQHYSNVGTVIRLGAGLAAVIPYFVLLWDLFRKVVPAGERGASGYAACAFILAPQALLLLAGFDVLRWVSFASLNCSILVLECNSPGTRQVLEQYVRSPRFMMLSLLSYAIGAMHVVDSNTVGSGVHLMARGLGLIQW